MSRSWSDLVGLLGQEAALRVAAAIGGEQVCVPKCADPSHRLAATIGDMALYGRMVWEWGAARSTCQPRPPLAAPHATSGSGGTGRRARLSLGSPARRG